MVIVLGSVVVVTASVLLIRATTAVPFAPGGPGLPSAPSSVSVPVLHLPPLGVTSGLPSFVGTHTCVPPDANTAPTAKNSPATATPPMIIRFISSTPLFMRDPCRHGREHGSSAYWPC